MRDYLVFNGLRGTDILSEEATFSNCFSLRSEKGSLSTERICSLLEQTPFKKGFGVQKSKQEGTKVVSLV